MTPDFTSWNLWIMRNCADCSVEACPDCQRRYAEVQTWGKDYTHEPGCEKKVKK